jgi:hypothetical protein
MTEARTSPSASSAQSEDRGIVDRVKETATAQLRNQKDRGTDTLDRVAEAVRSSTGKLRDERHDAIASYIDKAADHMENWSRHLRGKNVDELVSDAQRFARRQPAAFIGSAFALGLVGARFFKSSRQQSDFDYAGESRRARYGGNPTAGVVHDYSAGARDDEGVVATEVAISDVQTDATPQSSMASGGEGATRSARGRRTTSRTDQS